MRIGSQSPSHLTLPHCGWVRSRTGRLEWRALDLANLAVGGLLGAVIGYGANRIQQIAEHPRITNYGFLKRTPQYENGDLYKVWFTLGGRRGPGSSSIETYLHRVRQSSDQFVCKF